MKYPIINISNNNWQDFEDVLTFILEDPYYCTNNKKVLKTYFLNQRYCDSNGNIFVANRLNPIGGFWKSILSFLPGSKKGEIIFTPTTKTMELKELKEFVLDRVNELEADEFTMKWIGKIHNSKSHIDILKPEI
ncbi:hypothetical protein [Robertkochia aurantiaca]|uniref:hypothetical protein n=1 Tax=Robertkochia aurantiaca TaxID=2873700 RepID=UPI001CCA0436|nr:hypothetical protein [Robertkochia sp. 3YJGBD-33]